MGTQDDSMLVSDAELADALAECERANGDAPITLFEIETAAAFVLFARHPADIVDQTARLRGSSTPDAAAGKILGRFGIELAPFGNFAGEIAVQLSEHTIELTNLALGHRAGRRHRIAHRMAFGPFNVHAELSH